MDDPSATLSVRDYPTAPPQVVPREKWRFARLERGQLVPDPTNIYYRDGFVPGKWYEVIYTAVGAPLTGIGLAATRDVGRLDPGDSRSKKATTQADVRRGVGEG